jgi:hypothetical protein
MGKSLLGVVNNKELLRMFQSKATFKTDYFHCHLMSNMLRLSQPPAKKEKIENFCNDDNSSY